jgi:hypothetical protein
VQVAMVRGTGRGDSSMKVNKIKAKKTVAYWYNFDIATVSSYIALNWPKIYLSRDALRWLNECSNRQCLSLRSARHTDIYYE